MAGSNSRTTRTDNYTLSMFNSIRNDPLSGLSYLPQATVTNISTIKTILNTDPNAYNKYVTAMLTRIGDVVIKTPSVSNKFTQFYKGDMKQGHMTQEIFIEPITAEGQFDPNGTNPLGRRTLNNQHVAYHKTNYQPEFAITVDRVGMMDAFESWGSVDEYWAAQMKAMFTGEEWGRFNAEMKVVNDAIADTTTPLPSAYLGDIIPKDEASGKAFVQGLKYIINDMTYLNTMNQAGVKNVATRGQLVLLVNKDLQPNLDVYTMASLFNSSEADIDARMIGVPTFNNSSSGNTNSDVLGLLTTPDFFQFRRVMNTVRAIENPQGLFMNNFYHSWCSLQISPFAPAIVLRKGSEPSSSTSS